jgi:hypothetical protein
VKAFLDALEHSMLTALLDVLAAAHVEVLVVPPASA